MSGGYGPPVVNTFGMITGLGKAFDDAYDAGVKARQEREAPAIFSQLMGVQAGGTAPSTLGTLAQGYQDSGKLPSFASAGGGAGDYLRTVSGIESGGSDTARNPNSTATGRYQFTQDTWNGLARKYPDLGLTPNGRTDPGQQDRAMEAFTRDNATALSKAGVTDATGVTITAALFNGFVAGQGGRIDASASNVVSVGVGASGTPYYEDVGGTVVSAGATGMAGRYSIEAGRIRQTVTATPYVANEALSNVIPFDDTVPQSNEGTQILSVTITPLSATSKIRLRFRGEGSRTGGGAFIGAIFRAGQASAIRAGYALVASDNITQALSLEVDDAPATTGPVTYTVRVGSDSGSIRLNGNGLGRLFGGSAGATLVAEEIAG